MRALATAAAVAMLAGCGSIGQSDPLVSRGSGSIQSSLTSPSADPEHDRIVAGYGGVYDDPRAAQAVARAVGRIVAASDDPSQAYRITILNSPAVNAFALPSGNLYVTRGLLALADDTSEVAAVIAHEMAHVTARHAVARARRAEAASEVTRVVANVMQDQDAQRLALVSTQLSLARFSQVQELEADAIGVRTLARAGFDPFAASRFLSSMARFADYRSSRGGVAKNPDFLSSHPSTPERISFAVRAAREIGAPGIGEQEKDQYLSGLDGMVFGDDPSEGFVRGRSFLHKGLGIQFTVPAGYALENTTKAVLATDTLGTAMRFDGVAVPSDTALADYLSSGWVNGLIAESVRATTLGDLPAATATARADGWTFQIGVVRKANTVFRFIFAAQDPAGSLDATLAETMQSFHRLAPEDSARLRPLHLRIVRVKPGDTAEKLAEQMSGIDRKVDLFRVLNGLGASDPVEVGKAVKIVSEN
ncbi:metalloprotease [Siculibacillus lacustris]|uniref:Metalloprotease n=1 Tax=Siculibacillus lacustris TaxID=1549641 RepID=A0A4Q9VVV6_9HYPH|nr:M48 family metalloprotease [Siculibacillus lacustris]TBW40402.1 metalloprotease [Siculibacillus lacustris]